MQLNNDQQQAISLAKVDINNDTELRAWADRLNITKVQLKAAINAAGSSVKAVKA